jgi:hypothetical protein
VSPGHGLHTAPDEPHAPVEVPATQLPPVAAEQQPPLHAWVVLHAVVHLCIVVSHAWLAGQSAALLQPHEPDGKHALPLALPVQGWQTLPTAPHAACDVPG